MNDAGQLTLAYERRGDDTVLLIHAQDEEIDRLDCQLLVANPIPHLLPVAVQEQDTRTMLAFMLGSRKPLSEWLRTEYVSDERLLHFLLHIGDMLWRLRDYLLIENRLLLLPEAMYIQDQLLDVKFVYWPDKRTKSDEQQIAQQLKHLILHITKHGNSHTVIRSIMDYCDDPSFTLNSFRKRLLVWLDQANAFAMKGDEKNHVGEAQSSTSNPWRKAKAWLDSFILRQGMRTNSKRKGVPKRSDDSIVSSQTMAIAERSSVLNEASLTISQRGKHIQQIMIDQTPYMIGRDRQAVNLVNDDSQVSRIHAEIKRTEAGYVIRDLGSRNGTYINEQALTPYTDYSLQDQDKIQLGNTCYQFQLEGKSMV